MSSDWDPESRGGGGGGERTIKNYNTYPGNCMNNEILKRSYLNT